MPLYSSLKTPNNKGIDTDNAFYYKYIPDYIYTTGIKRLPRRFISIVK